MVHFWKFIFLIHIILKLYFKDNFFFFFLQAVKQVLTNLLISHVENRSEDSEDVQQYTHIRDIEKIVVPLGDRLNSLKSKFLDVS